MYAVPQFKSSSFKLLPPDLPLLLYQSRTTRLISRVVAINIALDGVSQFLSWLCKRKLVKFLVEIEWREKCFKKITRLTLRDSDEVGWEKIWNKYILLILHCWNCLGYMLLSFSLTCFFLLKNVFLKFLEIWEINANREKF